MKNKIENHAPDSKSRQILACFAIALLTGVGVGTSRAEDTATTPATTATANAEKVAHADKHFIMKAAMASSNELALSQLAVDHSSNAQVKSFAQDMVTAHQQLNNDLQSLAGQKNIDISKPVEKGEKDDVDSLAKKSGDAFDKAYIKKMVKGHEEAVSLFKKESEDGKDSDVTALASKYLPIVSDHLEHAKTLKQTVDQ